MSAIGQLPVPGYKQQLMKAGFRTSVEKKKDETGDRVVITMDGKVCPAAFSLLQLVLMNNSSCRTRLPISGICQLQSEPKSNSRVCAEISSEVLKSSRIVTCREIHSGPLCPLNLCNNYVQDFHSPSTTSEEDVLSQGGDLHHPCLRMIRRSSMAHRRRRRRCRRFIPRRPLHHDPPRTSLMTPILHSIPNQLRQRGFPSRHIARKVSQRIDDLEEQDA